jgi:hypothetical protein
MDTAPFAVVLADVTGHAQGLESRRKVVLDQPPIKVITMAADFITMTVSAPTDMINGQFFRSAAAGAGCAVVLEDAISRFAPAPVQAYLRPILLGRTSGIVEAFHVRAHGVRACSCHALMPRFRSALSAGPRLLFADPRITRLSAPRAQYLFDGHPA